MALFNHDTSRDQEPQLHTHAVVANVTQHNGEWKTLSSDKVGKTGFIENVYANQIAFGRLYREKLKEQVEALGYETEVVGKHGMWEMPGVPVEAFSGRSQTIREAVGEDASLKSRDVAALDTRKSKQHVDPEVRMVTPAGWQMLGVDMVKLHEQQQKRLRESEIRQQLIREGVLREDEDISVHAARKRWYLNCGYVTESCAPSHDAPLRVLPPHH